MGKPCPCPTTWYPSSCWRSYLSTIACTCTLWRLLLRHIQKKRIPWGSIEVAVIGVVLAVGVGTGVGVGVGVVEGYTFNRVSLWNASPRYSPLDSTWLRPTHDRWKRSHGYAIHSIPSSLSHTRLHMSTVSRQDSDGTHKKNHNHQNNNNDNKNSTWAVTQLQTPTLSLPTLTLPPHEIEVTTANTNTSTNTSTISTTIPPTMMTNTTTPSTYPTTHAVQSSWTTSTTHSIVDSVPPILPSYRAILVFVSTTILIWLSEPLLSLVDTTVVGKFPPVLAKVAQVATTSAVRLPPPETIQLAALGPATMICDTALYLTYFLAIATTNRLAIAEATKDYRMHIVTTSHVLGVGAILGSMILFMIHFLGQNLLHYILGSEGAIVAGMDMTAHVVASAWDYAKIRGYVAPFVVMGIMAQSVCLATLDTWTPAIAVIGATVANAIGDYWFVAKLGWGIQGAAFATALAGLMSAFILLWETYRKMDVWKLKHVQHVHNHQDQDHNQDHNHKQSMIQTEAWSFTTPSHKKTLLANKKNHKLYHQLPKLLSLPNTSEVLSLVQLAGPIFVIMLAKLICYSAMTLRASNFGMLELACHSIMLRIFYFYCTFGDSFSQAVQSYLPSLLFQKKGEKHSLDSVVSTPQNPTSLQTPSSNPTITTDTDITTSTSTTTVKTNKKNTKRSSRRKSNNRIAQAFLKRVLCMASVFAILNSIGSKCILERYGSIFTNDSTILSLLRIPQHVFAVAFSILIHPVIMILEGSIMANSDVSFLMKSYGITMVIMLTQLNFSKGLVGVWESLVVFQVVRLLSFAWRVWNQTIWNKKQG